MMNNIQETKKAYELFEKNNLTNIEKYIQYLNLLIKWNKAYNLTAITDYYDMATLHILDSLAINKWIKPSQLLDVGTGAGLPGIPLAIANPDLKITLLDSNGKKTRFLQEVKRALKLYNIEVVQNRAEDYQKLAYFDTVISRALSSIKNFVTITKHLIAKDGIWLAMKGQTPENELEEINLPYKIELYNIPEIKGKRCCIIINEE